MSVVPSDFEELKRYNLAEIFDPTPKEQPKEQTKEQTQESSTIEPPPPSSNLENEQAGQ